MPEDSTKAQDQAGGTKGGRRPTEVPPGAPGVSGPLEPNGRWSARRKRDVVLRLLRGEPLDAVSREIGVEIYRLEQWRAQALAALESGLKNRRNDPLQAELDTAMKRIGELTMENELLWNRVRSKPGPLAPRRSSK